MVLRSTNFKGYTTRASHLQQLAGRNNAAWNEFYEKYRAMIYGIGAQRKLMADECEDLLQEVAAICCKKLQDYVYQPEKCRFRTFLFKVTENVAFKLSRQKQKNECVSLDRDYSCVPELDVKFMHEYERFLLMQGLEELKTMVSSETYLAFDMLFCQNLPVKEVVALTGMSSAALYTLKHRCLKKLRGIISELRLGPGTPPETDHRSEPTAIPPCAEQEPSETEPHQ